MNNQNNQNNNRNNQNSQNDQRSKQKAGKIASEAEKRLRSHPDAKQSTKKVASFFCRGAGFRGIVHKSALSKPV